MPIFIANRHARAGTGSMQRTGHGVKRLAATAFSKLLPPRRWLMLPLLGALVAISHSPLHAQISFTKEKTAANWHWGQSYSLAWGDLDGDGWPDLYSNHHRQPPSLYRNNKDGTFTDVADINLLDQVITKRYQHNWWGQWTGDNHGAAWADVDNDGYQDLIQVNGGAGGSQCNEEVCGNQLYRNVENFDLGSSVGRLLNEEGDLPFEPLAIDLLVGRGRSPVWLDWNGDGRLDVFIANGLGADGQAPSGLFEQIDPGFVFADVSDIGGSNVLGIIRDSHQAAYLSDLTGDGRMELILLAPIKQNCTPATCLSYNQIEVYDLSTNPVSEVAQQLSLRPIVPVARDIVIADFNGDALPDIFLPLVDKQFGVELPAANQLLVNTGNGFVDKTADAGLGGANACHHAVAGDFDNDMDMDLYVVCLYDSVLQPTNILYENRGDAVFTVVPEGGRARGSILGRRDKAAVADYDLDGFLDLFLANGLDFSDQPVGPDQLYRNRSKDLGNANHWIEIDLRGIGPDAQQNGTNRDGIGARVLVQAGGIFQLREQNGGIRRNTQDYKRIHVGLGDNANVQSLIILWPSGRWQTFTGIPADQVIQVDEAGGWTSFSG